MSAGPVEAWGCVFGRLRAHRLSAPPLLVNPHCRSTIAEGGGAFLAADVDDVACQMGQQHIEGLAGDLF